MDVTLQPVLLGADMNCYSLARAFHECYGVTSQAFGRYAMGETKYSRIVRFTAVPNIDQDEVLLETLAAYTRQTPGATRVLMGCTDDYAAMLIRNREALAGDYVVPYIDAGLMEQLVAKEQFYRLCDVHGLPYPATVVLHGPQDGHLLASLPFAYPVIIKPSSSIQYWKHPFEGMQKVYVADDAAEAKQIAAAIFASGYLDSLIVQDMVPGADDGMRVATLYCDAQAKVRMACLGHVLLEEHTPKARGNHAAILTEYDRPLMEKLAAFLEAVGYTGYANFDIKWDPRDGEFKLFEINLRLGRSHYYVTGAGMNVAQLLVEDRVFRMPGEEPLYVDKESFWHSIPVPVVWQYTADEALASRAKAMADAGQDSTSLGYRFDMRMNPLRRLYLWEHNRRYYKKYASYCTKYRD